MKKYLLSTLAIAGLICAAGTAKAGDYSENWLNMSDAYGVAQIGYGFGYKDYKENAIMALGLGYHLNQYLRSDITVGWRNWGKLKADGKKADSWSIPALMNLYLTMPIMDRFSIYGMGGVGASYNKVKNTSLTKGDDKMEFAWTAGAGIDYRLNECWSFDLGYRFSDLGEGRSKTKVGSERIKKDIKSHDILLSARFYF